MKILLLLLCFLQTHSSRKDSCSTATSAPMESPIARQRQTNPVDQQVFPIPTTSDCVSNTDDTIVLPTMIALSKQHEELKFAHLPDEFAKFFSHSLDNQKNVILYLTCYSRDVDGIRTPIKYSFIDTSSRYFTEQFSYYNILEAKDTERYVLYYRSTVGGSMLTFFSEETSDKVFLISMFWAYILSIVRKEKQRCYDNEMKIHIQNNIEIENWIDDVYASNNDMSVPALDAPQEITDQFMYQCLAEAWYFNNNIHNKIERSNTAFKAIIGAHPFNSTENIEKNIDESLDFAARAFIYFTKIEYKDDKRLDCAFTNNIFVRLVDELKKKQSFRDGKYPLTELLQETVARVAPESAFFRFLNKTQ